MNNIYKTLLMCIFDCMYPYFNVLGTGMTDGIDGDSNCSFIVTEQRCVKKNDPVIHHFMLNLEHLTTAT